jgi:hypothetical protein
MKDINSSNESLSDKPQEISQNARSRRQRRTTQKSEISIPVDDASDLNDSSAAISDDENVN